MRIGPVGICPCCERFSFTIRRRSRNTAYVEESKNWLIACRSCQHEDDACYDELWADYYAGRL